MSCSGSVLTMSLQPGISSPAFYAQLWARIDHCLFQQEEMNLYVLGVEGAVAHVQQVGLTSSHSAFI